ncbi:hypothetical protein DKX38_001184 [Salix brachista]|uniref:MSP domain-containing protein n=1 Tax=Salix brachista TaxID=2182728 RepID=A0A5N5P2G2_9ROSI|nr:hypothetical protein DKX38_001184 [Salix brachista]
MGGSKNFLLQITVIGFKYISNTIILYKEKKQVYVLTLLCQIKISSLIFDYVELEKQSFCDLKVVNNTEHHVAFKVKTTSPKKYFVRPNTGVIQPWDSFVIRVTLQAQREYPPDMQCKDKFLLQSTIVPPHANIDALPPNTFNKDSDGKVIQEMKLRVVYMPPSSTQGNLGDEVLLEASEQSLDTDADANSVSFIVFVVYYS